MNPASASAHEHRTSKPMNIEQDIHDEIQSAGQHRKVAIHFARWAFILAITIVWLAWLVKLWTRPELWQLAAQAFLILCGIVASGALVAAYCFNEWLRVANRAKHWVACAREEERHPRILFDPARNVAFTECRVCKADSVRAFVGEAPAEGDTATRRAMGFCQPCWDWLKDEYQKIPVNLQDPMGWLAAFNLSRRVAEWHVETFGTPVPPPGKPRGKTSEAPSSRQFDS